MSDRSNIIDQDSNLVLFPGNGKDAGYIDDPLEELMNEFSHLEESIESREPEELCELAERHSGLETVEKDGQSLSDLLMLVEDQLDLLKDVKSRISYLEREMESYIVPSR